MFNDVINPKKSLFPKGGLLSLAMATIMTPAMAQDSSGWDSSKFINLLSNRLVETAVSAARSVAQVSYDNVTYDRHTDRFYLSNLYVVPFGLDLPDGCEVSVGGLGVTGKRADYAATDMFELVLDDVFVSTLCLPFEMRAGLSMAGLSDLVIPSVQLQFSHHYPSAATDVAVSTAVAGAAAVTLTAKMDYVSVINDMDFPLYAELNAAQITIENLGAWDSLSMQLPKEFKTPGIAGQSIAGLLTPELTEILGQQQGLDAAAQIRTAVDEFLQNPRKITLKTNIDPRVPLRLDPTLGDDFRSVWTRLNPTLRAQSGERVTPEFAANISAVNRGQYGEIEPSELYDIGLALQSGQRLPRNQGLARAIFEYLLAADMTQVAENLTDIAIDQVDFTAAYDYAQIMARTGHPRARAVLNKLETYMSLPEILVHHTFAPTTTYAQVKRAGGSLYELANQSLMGIGTERSYQTAYYWGVLALADGDQRAKMIIDRIESFGEKLPDSQRADWRRTITTVQSQGWTDWSNGQN